MIIDSISNSAAIESLHPLFKKAFDYVKSTDFSAIQPSKIILEEGKLFIIVSEAQGKTTENAKLEAHNQFIDIQIPIIGNETMGWIARKSCSRIVSPYNDEKDIIFYEDNPTAYVQLTPGDYVIFFPEDGHAPGIGEGFIKKVIVKIAI